MAEGLNISIHLKKVDNGFVLQVEDKKKWETSETIHSSPEEVLGAIRRVVDVLEEKVAAISWPLLVAPKEAPVEVASGSEDL